MATENSNKYPNLRLKYDFRFPGIPESSGLYHDLCQLRHGGYVGIPRNVHVITPEGRKWLDEEDDQTISAVRAESRDALVDYFRRDLVNQSVGRAQRVYG